MADLKAELVEQLNKIARGESIEVADNHAMWHETPTYIEKIVARGVLEAMGK